MTRSKFMIGWSLRIIMAPDVVPMKTTCNIVPEAKSLADIQFADIIDIIGHSDAVFFITLVCPVLCCLVLSIFEFGIHSLQAYDY